MLKKLTISAAALAVAAPMAMSSASAQELSVSASVDYVTQYVFRGVGLAEAAVQPGVEVGYGGLYGGIWYSAPVEDEDIYLDETDFYAGYGFAVSENISADVGVTVYAYSGSQYDATTEIYGGLSFDSLAIAPAVYAYYDFDLEAFTLEGSGGYSWPLAEATSLDLGAAVGTVEPDEGDGYQYASIGLAVSQVFTESVSGYAGINAGYSSEDTFIDGDDFEDTGIWAGVGLSFSN